MSKDKEFKAKNRDLNFEKKQNPDTVLGRQNRDVEQKTDFSQSKKNRMYQSRQTENISDLSNATENTAENVVKENTNFTVPEQSQTEQTKTIETVKHTQRKQADKFRADSVSEKTVHISVTENTEIQSDISTPVPKDERYNFQNVASENKQAFDIVNKNTDFRLGRQKEIPKETENTVKAKNKNRLYQQEQKKTVEAEQSVSSEQTSEPKAENSDNAEFPDNSDSIESVNTDFEFDRTAKYERRAERLYQKSEKAKKKASHKTEIKRKRIYDESKQKAKTCLQFEDEPSRLQSRRKRRWKTQRL